MNNDDDNHVKSSGEGKANHSASSLVGLGKDVVALLRDSALCFLALLLLVFPTTFNTMLSNAGFEEGSFVGFKWKPKLLQSDAALKDAQAIITDLREQNDKISKALADAQTKLNDPALKEQLTKIVEENKQLTAASSKVEDSVASSIALNAALVDKVQTAAGTNNKWGVVFSGDATIDAAKYEVGVIAPKLGIPNASIFFRQGSYRAVAVVDSKAEAERVLSKARGRRADAYIVSMSTWCPSNTEKSDYRQCLSP